jgi:parallel beta-helix repeat protein
MKKIAILLIHIMIGHFSFGATYYVAANGNDLSDGLSAATAFSSIDRVNQLSLLPGDSVLFNSEDTFRGMLVIQSSGTATNPIYIGAYGSGKFPVLSGAEVVTNWTNGSENIYQATCATCPDQPQQLFINDVIHIPARYPNSGYLSMTNVDNTAGTFTAADLNDAAGTWNGADLFLRTKHWVIDKFEVASYVPKQITYTIPTHFYTSYPLQENFGFFLSGKYIALDSVGEWFYDPATKLVSVIPVNADSLLHNGAEVSVDTNCVQFSKGVKYVIIENIQLEKSLEDAVFLDQTSFITISGCTIFQAGRDGVGGYKDYLTYNTALTVKNCLIQNIANTGINLTGGQQILLKGNSITNVGLIPGRGRGDDAGYGGIYCPSYSKVISNRLDSIGYTAIRIANYDTAIYNYCTNYGLTKNDCGGIYFWSGSYNYAAYNITGDGYGNGQGTVFPDRMMVEGIYSDDYSHDNVIEYNTSYRNESGIIIHNTSNSIVRNNVSYDNRRTQLYVLEGNPHNTAIEVYNNQVMDNVFQCLHPSQKALVVETEKNNIATMSTYNNNWYCNPYEDEIIEIAYSPMYASNNSTFRYTGLTLQQWRTSYGFDLNTRIAFDYPSVYAYYTPTGSDLIMNSSFANGTGWWWTYGNSDFALSAAAAGSQINSASLSGQYQNKQTLSPGNWGISSIQTKKDKQYMLSYKIIGESSGGMQAALTYANVPYTRNMTPVVIFKSFTPQLKTDTILFSANYDNVNSLNFNSSSFDQNFWMDDVSLYEIDVDTSHASPHAKQTFYESGINSSDYSHGRIVS